VPVDDAPALAVAMEKLLTDPGLRRKMGQTARHLAETRFSAAAVGRATVDLYRRLADNTA
jgi:glycosyltransferase involved in cell wall biosynthesis